MDKDMGLLVDHFLSIKHPKSHELIEEKFVGSILGNFLINDISRLFGSDTVFQSVVEDVGAWNFKEGVASMDIFLEKLQAAQSFKVLYLESPVFWRLKNALEFVKKSHPGQLTELPQYFHDMASAIKGEYAAGDVDFSDVVRGITAEIGGRVIVNGLNDLTFQEEGGSDYPLSQTAMGIVNFGMLGLLIEKRILDENTVLFIDEPEAHLHSAWQVAMAEVLFTLAERGVSIVMATHSADILKWLQVHAKENPDVEKIVALNHFQKGGTVESGDDFLETLSGIQDDLTAPYQDMFIRGLRA